MPPRYRVALSSQEREYLEGITKRGKHNARTIMLARALMLCDAGPTGPTWTSGAIVEALGVTDRTIEHLKKRFVEEGIEKALKRKPRETPPREVRFDGAFEARLLALACSKAPDGYQRWTIRLLAEKIVELDIADSVSDMTIQRTLKKMNISLTSGSTGKFHQRETLLS